MTTQSKITQATMMLLQAFADEVAKHKLTPKMTPDQIMAFFGNLDMSAPVSTKTTPEKVEVAEWDGDLGDVPAGIMEKRARKLLAIAQAGVPDGMKVHTKKCELFKPNKQHAKFYTNGCFSGPNDEKESVVIDWLVTLAGDVGPPEEPEVVAQLPEKWNGDKKKAVNLLMLVIQHKKKAEEKGEDYKYVNWESSRGREQNDDTLVYDDEFEICGSKKLKSEFLNLVAWYQEHPGVMEEAEAKANKDDSSGEEKKGKGKKAAPKAKGKGKTVKIEEPSDDDSEKVVIKEKKNKSKEIEEPSDDDSEKVVIKEKKNKSKEIEEPKESEESTKESEETKKTDEKTLEEPSDTEDLNDEDDESSCDDEEEEKASESTAFVLDYNQEKLDKVKAKVQKLIDSESEKFINAVSKLELGRTPKTENKFIWYDDLKIAVPKTHEEVADDFIKMFQK